MARMLSFVIGGQTVEVPIERLDRKKLYGWVDRKAYDREGKECYFGTVSGDGLHIFGRESFESGYLDQDGDLLSSENLVTVDDGGTPLEKQEASFKGEIVLDKTVSVDTYLDHVIRSVYELEAPKELLEAIKQADGIYAFPFNYTASYQPDPAFLIESNGTLFMLIGEPGGFDFIGLAQSSSPDAEPDPDGEDEEDVESLDFSMF